MFFNCLPNCFGLFLDYFCSSPPPPRVRTQLVHLPIQLEPKIGSSPMEVQQRKPTVAAATIQLEHKVLNCVFKLLELCVILQLLLLLFVFSS